MTPQDVLTLALVQWHALRIARAWRDGRPDVVKQIQYEVEGNYGADGLHIIEQYVPDMYMLLLQNEEKGRER